MRVRIDDDDDATAHGANRDARAAQHIVALCTLVALVVVIVVVVVVVEEHTTIAQQQARHAASRVATELCTMHESRGAQCCDIAATQFVERHVKEIVADVQTSADSLSYVFDESSTANDN